MNKDMIVLSIVVLISSACSPYTIRGEWNPTRQALEGVAGQGGAGNEVCKSVLPPKTFQELDLVGTWVAMPGTATDTLILKEDHTYKQIYNDPITGDHFESDWQRWWIEYRPSGIPYLHLQGMWMCYSDVDKECGRKGGGTDDRRLDPCEGRLVSMQSEVILLILGVPPRFEQPPRGIELAHLLPGPDSGGCVYELQPPFISPTSANDQP